MDTHGLPNPAAVLHGPGYNPFIHGITSSDFIRTGTLADPFYAARRPFVTNGAGKPPVARTAALLRARRLVPYSIAVGPQGFQPPRRRGNFAPGPFL